MGGEGPDAVWYRLDDGSGWSAWNEMEFETDDRPDQSTARIIDDAPGLTTGQLIARIRKLAITVDPETGRRRYEQAVADRRVVLEPTDDGTANLYAMDLPPHTTAAARRRINELAKTLRRPDETRTMDQLRADVYLDLLCGVAGITRGGTVDIHVDLGTLTGLSNQPGELAGYGPVIDDITRHVIADNTAGQWRYTVTHQGYPMATGTTRRRPTTGQQRIVETAHPTCIFPGCRIPATESDIDHRIEWAKTHTTITRDLAPFCRHDHCGKHKHGWTYQILPNGDIKRTNPLGHTYTTHNSEP